MRDYSLKNNRPDTWFTGFDHETGSVEVGNYGQRRQLYKLAAKIACLNLRTLYPDSGWEIIDQAGKKVDF